MQPPTATALPPSVTTYEGSSAKEKSRTHPDAIGGNQLQRPIKVPVLPPPTAACRVHGLIALLSMECHLQDQRRPRPLFECFMHTSLPAHHLAPAAAGACSNSDGQNRVLVCVTTALAPHVICHTQPVILPKPFRYPSVAPNNTFISSQRLSASAQQELFKMHSSIPLIDRHESLMTCCAP